MPRVEGNVMTSDLESMESAGQPCPQPSITTYVGADRLAAKPRVWREGGAYVLELVTAQDVRAGFAQVETLDEKTEDGRALHRVTARLPEPPTNVTLTKDEGIIAESWKSHTLWLFGGGHLAKHGKSDDARIIHMPDASDIRSETFAEFADLEEVSFGNPRVRVGNRAFAQCHRLRTVSFPNGGPSEGWAADNAFFDTPYDAEREHPYGPHRLRAIMYYRKFEIADPLE